MSLIRKRILYCIYAILTLCTLNNTYSSNHIKNGPVAQSARINKTSTLKAGLYNLSFKSKIDGSSQPLKVKVPTGYSSAISWPLLVTLHGLGDGPIIVSQIDSMVQIGPFGRGDKWYRGLGQKDVFESIEFAKQIFNIDPNRIYLCGFSMGGVGTFELGLKYPDVWAACVPVCGSLDDLELVENGKNLPFWINAGDIDKVIPAKYSRKAYQRAVKLGFNHWKYTENEGMGHSFRIDWGNIEKWLHSHKRIQKPSYIIFCIDEPSRAYWIEITKKIKEKDKAKIKAQINGQVIQIQTSNVAHYSIYLDSAPIEFSKDIVITENGNEIFQGSLDRNSVVKSSLEYKPIE